MDKFGIENKLRSENNIATDFRFRVWSEQSGYTQSHPYIVHNTTETQTMEEAVLEFVESYDKKSDLFFAKNCSSPFNNSQCSGQVFVQIQDWRGHIVKFEIIVEARPFYIARRIK